MPFLLATGAGLYFTYSNNINMILSIGAALLLIICGIWKRVTIMARAGSIFLFGIFWAALFTQIINTPQMPRNSHNTAVTGRVTKIDYTDDKARVFIKINAADINAGDKSAIIRVSVNTDNPIPNVDDTIQATVGLYRPTPPDAPGAFDYARWLYFNNISATGYLTEFETIKHANISGINALRDVIHKRTNSFLGDSLILGYKNAVPKDDAPIWTATGIGHVWSISGFHITLVAGWMFFIFCAIFRCIPPILRRVPARIPATFCAWAAIGFYLFLSGIDVATIRAFLMTSLVFAAFVFGRTAISMRNVCIAFCIIFLINPHYVMQAGFQLSFAAIFGLVWIWCVVKPKMPQNKLLRILYTTILTSVIATIFTAPFVAMHFGGIPIYSIIGNLVLLPIFSFAIMPLVIVGLILGALFNWGACLGLAHNVYDFTLPIAKWIAQLPYATVPVPYISNAAICIIILTFMCLIFVRPIKLKINWILFAIFLTTAVLIIALTPRPVFFATHDHELVGFVVDGKLKFNKSRASNHFFTFDTWKQLNAEQTNTPNKRYKHDKGLYIFETENFKLAYMQKFVPLQNNLIQLCNDDDIDYIVSFFRINAPKCDHKILNGGFVIYESGRVKYVPNNRRWHNPRE